MAEEEATVADGGEEDYDDGDEHHDLRSLLASEGRDFLVRNNGDEVKISELEGKTVGLYFSGSWCGPCRRFTPILAEAYTELASRDSNFEIVFVSSDKDEEDFSDYFSKMPWLAIPFSDDDKRDSLSGVFDVKGIPTLVIIDKNGKILTDEAVQVVRDYGAEGYPFTAEKIEKLEEEEEVARMNQTIKSLLVTATRDFLLTSNFKKVSVSDLVGKNILFYFSAHWCPPCRAFLPHLIEVYNKIKEKDDAFEIIFISSDEDEESFEDYFLKMPWLALPFSDERKRFLTRVFKISGIPSCVAINRAGKTVTKEARSLIMEHGANAYPFTEESIQQLKAEMEEKAKHWPEKIRHKEHSHVLWKSRREYICDGCEKWGRYWSFCCKKCNFDLHPDCALNADHDEVDSEDEEETAEWPMKIKHMLHKHTLIKAGRCYQCDACAVIKQGWSYFCEECDFDLHPECALKNQDKFKVIDDSDDESEEDQDEDTEIDEDDIDNYGNMNGNKIKDDDEDIGNVEDGHESLPRDFKQELQLEDDTDGVEEKEEKESKIENDDENKNDVEDKENEGEEHHNETDDEEDDEDGPGMRGYVCNSRDRERSESFQESLFTCKLYK